MSFHDIKKLRRKYKQISQLVFGRKVMNPVFTFFVIILSLLQIKKKSMITHKKGLCIDN